MDAEGNETRRERVAVLPYRSELLRKSRVTFVRLRHKRGFTVHNEALRQSHQN